MADGRSSHSKRILSDPLGHLLENIRENPIPGVFSSSSTDNCVVLHDWWLVRSVGENESKGLAVSGYTAKNEGEIPFISAPIVKRHDSWTLEAADGVTVKVEGTINQTYTRNNGFSQEVCQHFTVGFPSLWKQYVDYHVDSTLSSAAVPMRIDDKTFGDSSKSSNKESEPQHEDGPISTDCKEAEEFATPEKDAGEFATPEKDAAEAATPEKDAGEFATPEKDAAEVATPEKDAEEFATPEKDDTTSDKQFSTAGRRKIAVSKSKVSDMSPTSGKRSSKKDHAPQSIDITSGRGRRRANLKERGAAISHPISGSNIRRTRSGRAVIPTIDKGSQTVVYDRDGNFAGVATTISACKGSTSKPSRKKKRC